MKVTELLLTKVPMQGNPSYLHVKAEDVLQTIDQLDKADIKIFGKNLSEVSSIGFELEGGRKVLVNREGSMWDWTGEFTEEDKSRIADMLSGWGV